MAKNSGSEAHSKARAAWENKEKAKVDTSETNQQTRAERTDEQQLAKLDKLLGEGVGATRERERLTKRIAKRQEEAQAKKEKTQKKERSGDTEKREAPKDSD